MCSFLKLPDTSKIGCSESSVLYFWDSDFLKDVIRSYLKHWLEQTWFYNIDKALNCIQMIPIAE